MTRAHRNRMNHLGDLMLDAAEKAMPMRVCEWKRKDEDSDTWQGDCGILWTLNDGTPSENKMVYCPKCGLKIIEAHAALDGKEPES